MKSILTVKHTSKKAQLSILYLVKMGNIEINQYNASNSLIKLNLQKSFVNRYLFAMRSSSQKIFFILKLFYPSHEDSVTLKLPKSFYFLYFPLRPFFMGLEKVEKIEFIKRWQILKL